MLLDRQPYEQENQMKISASCAATIAVFLFSTPFALRAEDASRATNCPGHLHQRTTEEVLQAHLAAFQSGNAELVACDYAKDAVFVMPGAVTQGRADIEAAFGSFIALAGGNIGVTTNTLTIVDDVAQFEYSVTSDHVVITDGVDTFLIENGLIVLQTARLGGFAVK